MTRKPYTPDPRAVKHAHKKTLEAIELANNATLISTAGGAIVFIATRFAAEGIARSSMQEVVELAVGHFDGRNEPDPNTYAVAVRPRRVNRPGVLKLSDA